MKIRNFVLLQSLCLLLFCAACGDSSDKQKTSDRETTSSDSHPSRERSNHSAPAEQAKPQPDKSQKAGEEKKQDTPPSAQPGNSSGASAPRKEAGDKSSASRPGQGERSGGGKSASPGKPTSGGRQSTHSRPGQPIPSGWIPSAVNNPPPPNQVEIWNKILSKLQNLIIARQVKFSPLGAEHASLTALSNSRYKATGRCIVVEKDGNQLAYEFECIAIADEYAARIISADFRSPNK